MVFHLLYNAVTLVRPCGTDPVVFRLPTPALAWTTSSVSKLQRWSAQKQDHVCFTYILHIGVVLTMCCRSAGFVHRHPNRCILRYRSEVPSGRTGLVRRILLLHIMYEFVDARAGLFSFAQHRAQSTSKSACLCLVPSVGCRNLPVLASAAVALVEHGAHLNDILLDWCSQHTTASGHGDWSSQLLQTCLT